MERVPLKPVDALISDEAFETPEKAGRSARWTYQTFLGAG